MFLPHKVLQKTKVTIDFMKRKMHEYDELKKELENKKLIMWAILKYKKNNLEFLKSDLKRKLGEGVKFYLPKNVYTKIQK